jgi:hypothetical protein
MLNIQTAVSNPSGGELLDLFDVNEFNISTPQCPTHYPPVGNGDVLNTVVSQNVRQPGVIISDILDSDHQLTVCQILDHVKIKNILEPVEKFTDWEWFQSLACDLISSRIEINFLSGFSKCHSKSQS